ncbi:hypothetical protein SCUCBS95973_000549 [Sporothrix curviconia]|uniref:Uncharacterized protein n=1 Tax=Sporothrix curviconia TaxID=1260050 RepID=A0ABP0AR71_9PEZI
MDLWLEFLMDNIVSRAHCPPGITLTSQTMPCAIVNTRTSTSTDHHNRHQHTSINITGLLLLHAKSALSDASILKQHTVSSLNATTRLQPASVVEPYHCDAIMATCIKSLAMVSPMTRTLTMRFMGEALDTHEQAAREQLWLHLWQTGG